MYVFRILQDDERKRAAERARLRMTQQHNKGTVRCESIRFE